MLQSTSFSCMCSQGKGQGICCCIAAGIPTMGGGPMSTWVPLQRQMLRRAGAPSFLACTEGKHAGLADLSKGCFVVGRSPASVRCVRE